MKVKKIISNVLAISLVLIAFAGCSNEKKMSSQISKAESTSKSMVVSQEPVEIMVSAASSMTESLTKIADEYKKVSPNVTIKFNFGASGTLQTQIEEGAPADIFFSASTKQMNTLEEKDLTIKESRKDLLKNKIVLIALKDSNIDIKTFEDCATNKVSMIAIGNPDSVPVGQYTQEIFTKMNLWDKVLAKANLATNVKEVLTWVETGNIDCGIVYKTDAITSDKIKIICSAPEGSHKAVIYPVAILKSSKNVNAAQAFVDYLSTEAAQSIFVDYGFLINK